MEKKKGLIGVNEDNLFVFEKSVEADRDSLNSIRKSIENERNKAGLLLGFFFLIIMSGMDYFLELPMFLGGFCFAIITVICFLLIQAFCSRKVNDGIITDRNFENNWDNKKEQFLKFYHQILRNNINDQKKVLTENSKRNRYSVILLSILILILFLNFNFPMSKDIFLCDDNPISSSVSENKPDTNTMTSDSVELSENIMNSEKIEKTK